MDENKIEVLSLPVRPFNLLRRNGVHSIDDLKYCIKNNTYKNWRGYKEEYSLIIKSYLEEYDAQKIIIKDKYNIKTVFEFNDVEEKDQNRLKALLAVNGIFQKGGESFSDLDLYGVILFLEELELKVQATSFDGETAKELFSAAYNLYQKIKATYEL